MEASVVAHPLKRVAEKVQFRYSDMNLNFELVCFRSKPLTIQTDCLPTLNRLAWFGFYFLILIIYHPC